ncbi:MAG: NADH-quinone oxidoreductase subunit G [Gammaproteobacteria bacterium]|nr:NADH-quinone oxidoreductase subunit G [Gammaproteobacteria bacterium]
MVNIEIDGKKLRVANGAMLIEAADEAGIKIPRFCYHKKLPIAANCRMCLVDVEKAAKPLPACATPVTDGMVIHTKSTKAIAAQKSVMEFLLINHPLDCPICDQGGECELQDVAIGYGDDVSRYSEKKRVVHNKNLGPLINTDMTRCIHCTRCVRFGEEIAGIKELGMTGRGEHAEIGTYVAKTVSSEMSGNVIDLCPVGALTSKPFRYSARAWELRQHETIAAHDCIGSNIFVHTRHEKIMRVVPKENESINETWISDRDRFSYEGLNSKDRLLTPLVKENGEWRETDWDIALRVVVEGLKDVVDNLGAASIGTLISPSATLEEMYLAQKLMRSLGCNNIDHRLRQQDFRDQDNAPVIPWLGQSIKDLEQVDAALLIGSNIRKDQPIAGHRIRKAAISGANIMVLNPVDYEFLFPVTEKIIVDPRRMSKELGAVAKALFELIGEPFPKGLTSLLQDVQPNGQHKAIAQHLKAANNGTILLGLSAHTHLDFSTLRALASLISDISKCTIGYLTDGANSPGGWLAGAVPHRNHKQEKITSDNLNASEMLRSNLKAFVLQGIEPEKDCANHSLAVNSIDQAEFVVGLSMYKSDSLLESANVLLPISPFTETSGTFVNIEGRWQSFQGAVSSAGDSRPTWKIWRVLGNLFNVDGFDYMSSEEIRDEVRSFSGNIIPKNKIEWQCPTALQNNMDGVVRIVDTSIYSIDPIVRRATALQQTADALTPAIHIGEELASRIGLMDSDQAIVRQGDGEVTLPVKIDYRLPAGSVLIPPCELGGTYLGHEYSEVKLEKI